LNPYCKKYFANNAYSAIIGKVVAERHISAHGLLRLKNLYILHDELLKIFIMVESFI